MRITFVLDTFGGGGKERRCLQLIQGLNYSGITDIQVIIVNNNVAYPEIYQTTAQVIIINRKQLSLSNRDTYKILKKHIHDFEPDIVQGWGFLSLFYLNWIRIAHKFIYIASHVADANKPKGINKWINLCTSCLADAIIGNSLAGLNSYKVPKNKSYCFYNGFNSERLKGIVKSDNIVLKRELNLQAPYIVTMVARVDANKDYSCFVNIARKICMQRNDVIFLALGKGELLDLFQKDTNRDKNIHFLGFRTDVEKILSITSVSVLCTNYKKHAEGISNTILESMSLGVPVVATLCGGTSEIIDDGKNGFCIENNDVDDFVNKILYLIDNEDCMNRFSRACKRTVDQKFSLDKSTKEYIDLYYKLIKHK